MLAILAFAIASLSPTEARSTPAFMQAAQLEALCGAGAEMADLELCAGYILGSVDQVLAEQDVWGRRRAVLCLPADVTVDQLKAVVMAHAAARPDQKDSAAAALIASALKSAYPCLPRRGGR